MKDETRSGVFDKPDIRNNYIYRLIYEIMSVALPVITLPYISRVLGADGVGEYSYSYSVITYFMLIGALGTSSYGTREIARNRDDKKTCSRLFWEIELMSMAVCLVSIMTWMIPVFYDTGHRLFFIALTPFLLGTMFDITWFYTGLERIKTIVLANAAVRVGGVVLMFVLVRTREDVAVYCAVNSLTQLAASLSMWFFLPKYLVRCRVEWSDFGHHFRETFVYFIPTIARSIYTVLDKTLIGLITGSPFQNGYYEQSSKIIWLANGVSFSVFNSVLYPRMSYLFATMKSDEVKEKITRATDYILFMCYGAAFGLLGIGHILVPVIFGEGYEPAEILIYMMLPLIPVIGISNCLGNQYYTPVGKRLQSSGYIVAGAIVNLVLNLCLIPFYGARGAVAASVAAELLITGLYIRNCDGYLTLKMIGASSVKRIFAGACMALTVFMLGHLNYNGVVVLLLQIAAGAVMYIVILYILKDSIFKRRLI